MSEERFELQSWWGRFSPVRLAVAGRIHAEPAGSLIELWTRPSMITQLFVVMSLISMPVWVLAMAWGNGSQRWLFTATCLPVFAFGLLASRWSNPLGEEDVPRVVEALLDVLAARRERTE